MAKPFNLIANLQIRGPVGVDPVIRKLKSEFKNVEAKVDIKLGSAVKDIKRIEGDFRKFNATLQETTVVANRASQALSGLSAALSSSKFNQASSQISSTSAAVTKMGTNFRTAAKDIDHAAFSAEKFGRDSALALKRFLAFTIPTTITFGLVAGFVNGSKAAIEFERQLTKVAQTVKQPLSSLGALQGTITKLSTSLGVSSEKLSQVGLILAQAGLTAKDTEVILSGLAKTELSASFEDIINTTDGVIAAMNQFKIPAKEVEGLLNSINEVSARYPVEAKDIITTIQKTGGAFRAAGGDIEQLIALFSSVRSTTRESADAIATGIRTISGRLQRPETIDALAEIGVDLRDASGQFVGVFEAFNRIGAVLSKTSSQSEIFASIVEEIGGLRQLARVIPAIQQYAKAQEILAVAREKNNSLDLSAKRAQESLGVQIDKLRESFLSLFRDISSNPFFKTVATGFVNIAQAAFSLAESLTPILPIIGGLGLAKFGTALQGGLKFAGGFSGFFSNQDQVSSEDKLNAILAARAKEEEKRSKEKQKALNEEKRAQDQIIKEQKAADRDRVRLEKEAERKRDKAIRLEKQASQEAKKNALAQEKLNVEKQKAAAVGGRGVGGVSIDKNTASLIALTKAVENLTKNIGAVRSDGKKASAAESAQRTNSGGGRSRRVGAPNNPLFRDPETGKIISRGAAQKIGNLTSGNVLFSGPTGKTGGNLSEVRRAEFAAQMQAQSTARFVSSGLDRARQNSARIAERQEEGLRRNRSDRALNPSANTRLPSSGTILVHSDGTAVPVTGEERVRRSKRKRPRMSIDEFLSKPDTDKRGAYLRRRDRDYDVALRDSLDPGDKGHDPRRGFRISSDKDNFSTTQANEKNIRAGEKAEARRALNARLGKGAALAAAIAIPSIVESLSPDRIGQASKLTTSAADARTLGITQGISNAATSGISTGLSVGFATGNPLIGGIAGVASAAASLATEMERIQNEVIANRLAGAIDLVVTNTEKFKDGLISSAEFLQSFATLGSNAAASIASGRGQGTVFGSLTGNKEFSQLGFGESTLAAVQQLFTGGTQFEELRKSRTAEQRNNIQQAGAATFDATVQGLSIPLKKAVESGIGSVDSIIATDEIQKILSNSGVLQAAASTNRVGQQAIIDNDLAKQEKIGREIIVNILKEQAKIELQIAAARKVESKVIVDSARFVNAFNASIRDLNTQMAALDTTIGNVQSGVSGFASLASGSSSTAALSAGRINADVTTVRGANIAGNFLGGGANQRLQQIQSITNSIIPGITEALAKAANGRVGATTSLETLRLGGTDKAPLFLKDFISQLSEVDQARVREVISGGKELFGKELQDFLKQIKSDQGRGIIEGGRAAFTPEQDAFNKALGQMDGVLNSFASNLDSLSEAINRNKQLFDQVSDRQLQLARNAAQNRAARTGIDAGVSDATINADFNRRRMFAGSAGDVGAIGSQAIRDIAEKQKELNDIRSGNTTLDAGAAANRQVQLITEINSLNTAVRDARDELNFLATETTRLQHEEEKLTKAVADRQARENFNRNFAGQGGRQQFEQALNLATFTRAVKAGRFANAEEAQRGIAGANSLNGIKFADGRDPLKVLDDLIKASGLAVLPSGVTKQEDDARAARDKILNEQIAAIKALQEVNATGIDIATSQNNNTVLLIDAIKKLTEVINVGGPVRRAGGGIIPGSGNTDSVHALLTPGEYVLRKDAVRRIGLSALQRMNNGSTQRFANGGFVNLPHYNDSPAMPGINTQQMMAAVNQFSNSVNLLSASLEKFTPDITINAHHTVDVRILGGEVFSRLQPMIENLVMSQTTESIRKLVSDRFPESGPPI